MSEDKGSPPLHEAPEEVAKKTVVQEGVRHVFKILPYAIDIGIGLLDALGYRRLSQRVNQLQQVSKGGTPPPMEARVEDHSKPVPDITPPPFGLAGFSHQDEARMKRLWDNTLRFFRESRPPQTNLPSQFAALSYDILDTYEKQEMLRDIITRDRDDRKATTGCIEMMYACQTDEDYRLYMYQVGVLTAPSHGERARRSAAHSYHERRSQIRERELARRRRLGIDK